MAMSTTGQQTGLSAEKLQAGVGEAEARLKVLQAEAEARKAKADMDEISGITAAKERVKRTLADMKEKGSTEHLAAKQEAEQGLKDLQAKLQRLSDRYWAWDDAAERRLNARLDEAEARIQVWKEHVKQQRAAAVTKRHNEMATLEEKIALARARASEARSAGYAADARAALEDAAHDLDRAYNAAARRYDKK